MHFKCDRCYKLFTYKRNLTRHLRRLKPCEIAVNQNSFKCEYCGSCFTHKTNYYRHKKKRCDLNKNIEKNIVQTKFEIEIDKSINITNINTIINNNINLSLNSLGNEELYKLCKKDILSIINKCYKAVPYMVKKIHIDIPENRNIYMPNVKKPLIMVFNNSRSWELMNMKCVIDLLINTNTNRLSDFINEYKEFFSNIKYNRLMNMINESENGELDNKYRNDIKLLLLNNKRMIKDYYQKNGIKLLT